MHALGLFIAIIYCVSKPHGNDVNAIYHAINGLLV